MIETRGCPNVVPRELWVRHDMGVRNSYLDEGGRNAHRHEHDLPGYKRATRARVGRVTFRRLGNCPTSHVGRIEATQIRRYARRYSGQKSSTSSTSARTSSIR